MRLGEALLRLTELPPIEGREQVLLQDTAGRILATDLIARISVPPHDNSAMDGYAFRFADLPADYRMRIAGRAAAGHPLTGPIDVGTAVRVLTGAMMPAGTDTVVPQERCTVDDCGLLLTGGLVAGENRRLAGEDFPAGARVLEAGMRLRPQDIAIAASIGCSRLVVRRRLRVALFATGDELRAPGEPLSPGAIYDTNRHMMIAALQAIGVTVADLGIIRDERVAIRDALMRAAAEHDLVLTSGGVSVGDEDHVRSAVTDLGDLGFWKLAVKPGKPVAFGSISGVPFLGLPGNPAAAMIMFCLVARPLVLHLAGATHLPLMPAVVPAAFSHRRKAALREYLPARVVARADGRLEAEISAKRGSAMLSAMAWARGLVEIGEDRGEIAPGDLVDYLPFEALLS